MAGFRCYNLTWKSKVLSLWSLSAQQTKHSWKWELGVRGNGAGIFHLQWKFQIIPNAMAEMHLQEEQMGACEHGSFRRSGEDVLAKSPQGVHLVQAKTTYSMRRLNEAWKCLQLWGGGLVEGTAFSWETSLCGSWWWLSGQLWERRKKMSLWGGNTVNPTHPLQGPFVGPLTEKQSTRGPAQLLLHGKVDSYRFCEFRVKDRRTQGQLSVGIQFPPAVWYYFSQHGFPCCNSLSLPNSQIP